MFPGSTAARPVRHLTDLRVWVLAPVMDAPVLAALVTAIASLIVAALTIVFAARRDRAARNEQDRLLARQSDLQRELESYKDTLAQQAKLEERAFTAQGELDRVRQPLLAVALDLADRLNNIRNRWFLEAYSSGDGRHSELARTGTLYRFARYWCVVETLYDRADLARLLADESTHSVAYTLREIGRTFATDKVDGRRLMIWREEQRAIAERARDDKTLVGCIGYATFVERYDRDFACWFASFEEDWTSVRSSERLRLVQGLLVALAQQLTTGNSGYYQEQLAILEAGSARSV
jgi:cell division protein FtsL